MKLQDLLKDLELGKVYTDKDRKPFKVNEDKCNCNCHSDKIEEDFGMAATQMQPFSSKEAKAVLDSSVKEYAKLLRKAQYKIVKDWMAKAKAGVIDYYDIVRGLKTGDVSRAHTYETDFLFKVLNKDKIVQRFNKYFGGKKSMNQRLVKKHKRK
tara:strand:+ start:228 stop:689 length:462 start_codon:yes stop_codon:yes gene_type:complete